ncbi:Dicer-like protein 1 [Exophiala xenobiotica]|nr:Dicer-like protein 1 [Exophiala xenobiotica]KAK5254688.1 Dicer-like protein 1 [Exophiala xenobiotica]KAK5354729.1 Dicer-like protein 1 [Exophiala xenobiotica]KAK5381688.1 Dicer-like protein 1 [Exophiala xenobiotica]KAK5382720.1 Dicer-like protein 1 [Exophiala xenobiotica]
MVGPQTALSAPDFHEPMLIDLDEDEAGYLTESDNESQDGSNTSDATAESDREANKAILNDYVLKTAAAANDRRASSPGQTKNKESDSIINQAREYQQELFERAKEQNVIAVLDTGSGKTLIAALLIRHFLQQELIDRSNGKPGKIVFFLVNSVHLARQQARFLNNNLPQNVRELFGEANEDLWRRADWENIFANNSVVVCTAAVLDQCLMHSFLTMGQISLLIFDEAHHCKKNHPYSRIIRDYYLKWSGEKPRIFGMTASPVDSKRDIVQVVNDLEALLQSKIVTTQDASVFEFAPRATDDFWTYPPLHAEFDTELSAQLRPLCGFIEDLKKYFTFSRYASRELGTWAADRVWKYGLPTSNHEATAVIKQFERSRAYIDEPDNNRRKAALDSVQQAISLVKRYHFGPPGDGTDQELSPKLKHLLMELKKQFSGSKTARGIVFVEQRFTAFILCDLFEMLKLTNLRPGVLVGVGQATAESSPWRDQQTVMEKFRSGRINLIFATSVAEEGIDIPQCNLVVRFDLYETPIQYMQSRGRARMKNSVYAHMIEEGNQNEAGKVDYAIQMDDYIRRFCQNLPPDRLLGQGSKLKQLLARDASCQSFETATGVVASYSNSLLLLTRYAESLQRIGAASAEVYEEIIDPETNMFRYKVILPATEDPRTAKVKGALGDPRTNKVLARRSAAWHCCFKLRKAELLDTNLDSIFVKVKPANLNARIAVSEKKDNYEKKLKPDFWLEGGANSPTLPTRLFVTQVVIGPSSTSTATNSLLLFTRSLLPQLPSFPVYVDDNVERQVTCIQMSRPVTVTEEQIDVLTKFTINGVFSDVFHKTFALDPNSMSYWLGPPAKEPLRDSFETIVNMEELLLAGNSERRRWAAITDPEDALKRTSLWCNAFLVDPGSGKFRYFTEHVEPEKSIWDAPPEVAINLQKKHKDTIIGFTDSTYGKYRKDQNTFASRYDAHQPVLKAKVVLAGRNNLKECPPAEQRFAPCYIAPQPLELARVSPDVAAFCVLWPSILHRVESYLIVREAYIKLDLTEVPLDLALEAFTQGNSADNAAIGDIHSELDGNEASPGAAVQKAPLNYERLEFIGDSLLKMMTTVAVFTRTTCNEEGMHCKRMDLLSNSRLCTTASAPHYELFRYIRASSDPHWQTTWYPEFLKQTGGNQRRLKLDPKHKQHALGKKTIADVCEATIGACIMASQHLPTEQKFDLGIRAITKLVDDPDHALTSWKEIAPMYKPAAWSLQTNDPVADDLANKIEQITGYTFRHPRLVRSAFTHSSDQNSPVPDLQRLEFLGDACLDWVCIWWLFSTNPTRDPQWLTEHKMAMVSNKFLAALAVVLGFHRLINATTPALYEEIGNYSAKVQEIYEQADVKRDFWTRIGSGCAPPKALADLVESYLGAVLLDSNFDFDEIENFFQRHVKWFFEDIEAYDTFANRHPTTHLFRLLREEFRCQKSSPEIIEGVVSAPTTTGDREEGDDGIGDQSVSGVTVHVAWFVHGRIVSASKGQGAKYAKVRASKSALKILGKLKVDEFRTEWGCDCAQKGVKDSTSTEKHEDGNLGGEKMTNCTDKVST